MRKVLHKIQAKNETRMTYLYDGWIFNFMLTQKHYFFCMTDQQFGRIIPFTFLKDVSTDFFAKFGELDAMATSFDGLDVVLSNKMTFYNEKEAAGKTGAGGKIDAIQSQLDGVKDVMKNNLGTCLGGSARRYRPTTRVTCFAWTNGPVGPS